MRELDINELTAVSGAGSPPAKAKQGNNGFGNGPDANLAAPGNSGTTPGNKDGSLVR